MTLANSKNFRFRLDPRSVAAAVGLAALALAGCNHDEQQSQVAGWSLVDPSQRHPIMVSQQPSNLDINVARGSQGLSASQRAEVIEFTSRFRAGDAGNSRLVISTPSGSANEVAAMSAVDDIRQLLLDGGFSESSIAIEAYHDEHGGHSPVRVSYMRYVAEGPECGHDWSENIISDNKNVGHPNYGCTNQHNVAAMISNPADLLGPRTMSPRDASRRDDTYGKYIKGETTSSKAEEKYTDKLTK